MRLGQPRRTWSSSRPATADLLARAAHGLADDLLTNTLLTARCPVVLAPAMHTEMWEHPATVDNVAVLRRRGVIVLEPASGRLDRRRHRQGAAARSGRDLRGRAPGAAPRAASRTPDLAGRHVVVTAGGTREPLDPVRFLGNRSSGKQGYAFARAAVARGATVTLIAANVSLPDPAGVTVVRVGTTEELRKADARGRRRAADAVVMAAAPADFRPAEYADSKIKKTRGRLGAGTTGSGARTRTSPPNWESASATGRYWSRSRLRRRTRMTRSPTPAPS